MRSNRSSQPPVYIRRDLSVKTTLQVSVFWTPRPKLQFCR